MKGGSIAPDMNISDNLRRIRQEKGLTQGQVAAACGVSASTYKTYEMGRANPKPSTVARFAHALGVPVETIYGITSASEFICRDAETASALLETQSEYDLLIKAYSKLNEAGRKEALRRVDEMSQVKAYSVVAATEGGI